MRQRVLDEAAHLATLQDGFQADIQAKCFRFEKHCNEIEATEAIAAYILALEWHPLIDGGMLGIVNEAFNRSGLRIGFGAIKIEPAETEKYRVVVGAG